MIPHHQQAVDMAKLADGRAADPEIKELAAAIDQAQDPEINTMKGWLTSWDKPLPESSSSMGDMPGMDHGSNAGSGMPGMMSDKDMSDLEGARGKAFDKKFAQLMIGHHEGAVTMAEAERKNGSNADAKKLMRRRHHRPDRRNHEDEQDHRQALTRGTGAGLRPPEGPYPLPCSCRSGAYASACSARSASGVVSSSRTSSAVVSWSSSPRSSQRVMPTDSRNGRS